MKKLLLSFLILLCLQLAPTKAQWVTIPDTNFVNKLTYLFPGCMNGNQMDTTCPQIINAISLNIRNSNISNLSGIEYFANLNTLNCRKNQITNISFLPNTLTTLNCDTNLLAILPPLPNSLEYLSCFNNQISSLPVLPDSLLYLDCSYNPLSSLPSLPSSLLYLYCFTNQLTNLPSLPNTLHTLNCRNNSLSNLPLLPNSLWKLFCDNNQLTSLPILPDSLGWLFCGFNQLTSLPSLPSTLWYLICNNNQLTTLPAFSGFPSFPGFELNCSYNQLTSLPLMPYNLLALYCNNNQLTSLPPMPNLMNKFSIANNNISCVVNLPQVSIVQNPNISNNPLTCVPNQTNYSLGLPLCMDNDPINNPNNCPGVNITGFVYKDMNTNCTYENSDLRSENIPVKLYDNQNNFLAFSSTVNGVYSFAALQPDTFKVVINDSTLLVSMACGQTNFQNVTLNSVNQTISNINFPVICDTTYDLFVQSLNRHGLVFPGQTHTVKTNIANNAIWYNLNCTSVNYSGSVSIQVTGPITYVSPVIGALNPSVNGNTFTYNITDFNSLTPESFGLQFNTDTTAQAGDQICVHVEINPTPMDGDTSNNHYDFCYNVVNSYDPNIKEVYPINVSHDYDDWFTYTIHFQNTGNASAINIRVRDTLDPQLDINTFEVRGYSHPATISLNGNILTVRFNNIMLPDSTTDYQGSMGYFQYRIKALPNLINGAQILNKAFIYFDFNAPIITNTAQSNFDCLSSNFQQTISLCQGDSLQVGANWYLNNGNYFDTLASTFGCDSIVETNIILNIPNIDTTLLVNVNTIAAFNGYQNYEWINCSNDSTMQNSTNNIFTIPFSGIFKVKITNSDGCYRMSSCMPISITCFPNFNQQTFAICTGDSIQVNNNWYSSAGTFTDTLLLGSGCDSIITTVLIETNIDTSIAIVGDSLVANSGFSYYYWIDCITNDTIAYGTSNIFIAPFTGFFKAVITTSFGCNAATSCIPLIITKIESVKTNAHEFIIYPNPSTGIFIFKDSKNIKSVEIFNMMGELVLSQGNAKIINLQAYPKGIYVARINGLQVSRLVKE